jgi:hypothetical protein
MSEHSIADMTPEQWKAHLADLAALQHELERCPISDGGPVYSSYLIKSAASSSTAG